VAHGSPAQRHHRVEVAAGGSCRCLLIERARINTHRTARACQGTVYPVGDARAHGLRFQWPGSAVIEHAHLGPEPALLHDARGHEQVNVSISLVAVRISRMDRDEHRHPVHIDQVLAELVREHAGLVVRQLRGQRDD